MKIKRSSYAVLMAAALAMPALVGATQAEAKTWYEYKYTGCGTFESGKQGFVATGGEVHFKDEHVEITDAYSQVNTYTCSNRRPTTTGKTRGKLRVTVTAINITECTLGIGEANCKFTASTATMDSGWKNYTRNGHGTVRTDGDVYHDSIGAEVVSTAYGNWVKGSQDVSRSASARVED